MNNELKSIKGIGPKKEILLNEVGVFNLKDLLLFFPKKYEDRSILIDSSQLKDGEYAYLELEIIKKFKTYFYNKNMSQSKVIGKDTNNVNIIWYNQRFSVQNLIIGKKYKFYGIYNEKYKALINPIYCELEDDTIGRIYPIYQNIKGISNKELVRFIKDAYDLYDLNKNEILPKEILNKYNIFDLRTCIKNIHFPINNYDLEKSKIDIQIREILIIQLAKNIFTKPSNKPIKFKEYNYQNFMKHMPFELSMEQLKAYNEIYTDMTSNKKMNRLLQGDVGSGKTIIGILASLIAINSGYQAAFMAPTEILAKQHYLNYKDKLKELNIKTALLTGSINPSMRIEILTKLKNGEIDLCFGTHAIIQDDVKFKKLGLVIADEQQRFGVNQRRLLSDKGEDVDNLILSATPIPRTLALSIYGDLEISEINSNLPNRKKIDTIAVDYRYEKRIMRFLKKNIVNGGQIYIVCPAIDSESEKANVEDVYDKYKKTFSEFKVSFIHGKMESKDKEKIMTDFSNGDIDILISTTVIEVGIDVKNANIMVIYDANNFGLSQLHQLRGRVGRGERKSYCILLQNKNIDFTKIKFLESNDNGFDIAQKDLEYRGAGELFGLKQHGISNIGKSSFWLSEDTINFTIKLANIFNMDKSLWNINLEKKVQEEVEELKNIVLN